MTIFFWDYTQVGVCCSRIIIFSSITGEHSSIQATGPVPTVIKYSTQPSQKSDSYVVDGNKSRLNDTPVVIKYLQEYASPSSKESSVNNSKSEQTQAKRNSKDTKTEDGDVTTGVSATVSQKSPRKSVAIHSEIKPETVVSGDKNTGTEQSRASLVSKQREKENMGQPIVEPVKVYINLKFGVQSCQLFTPIIHANHQDLWKVLCVMNCYFA